MKIKKKYIIIGILVCVGVLLLVGGINTVYASGFLPREFPGSLYNKYPITHYSLNAYMDDTGDWWNWNAQESLTDSIFPFVLWFVNLIYLCYNMTMNVVGIVVQQLYSFDLVNQLADKIGVYVQNMFGFNEEIINGGLFSSFILLVITITAGWLVFVGLIKRETSKAMNGILSFLLIMIVALAFVTNVSKIMTGANKFSVELQKIVITPISSTFDDSEEKKDVSITIREQFFDMAVYKPYLLLQFGNTTIEEERVDQMLSLKPNSKERLEVVGEEKENGNEMMDGWDGLSLRIAMSLLIYIVNIVMSFVVIAFSGFVIWHQVLFLIHIIISPFILIFSLLPGKAYVAKRWFEGTMYELLMKVGITMLLTMMFTLSNIIFSMTDAKGYLITSVVQTVIYVSIYSFRGKLLSMFTGHEFSEPRKIGSMLKNNPLYKKGMGAMKNAIFSSQKEKSGNTDKAGKNKAESRKTGTEEVQGIPNDLDEMKNRNEVNVLKERHSKKPTLNGVEDRRGQQKQNLEEILKSDQKEKSPVDADKQKQRLAGMISGEHKLRYRERERNKAKKVSLLKASDNKVSLAKKEDESLRVSASNDKPVFNKSTDDMKSRKVVSRVRVSPNVEKKNSSEIENSARIENIGFNRRSQGNNQGKSKAAFTVNGERAIGDLADRPSVKSGRKEGGGKRKHE